MQYFEKKTKIVVTLGPATASATQIEALLMHGADVFRFNFSHGTHSEHAQLISQVQTAAAKVGRQPALLADLQGPKIRTGVTDQNQPITLIAGATVRLTTAPAICTEHLISIDYPPLIDELQPGHQILLNDGAIALEVMRRDRSVAQIECRVLNPGVYSSHQGVNFPNVALSIPALTEKDHRDLDFILTQGFHLVALSFVRRAADLKALRAVLASAGSALRIIAKIEKPEAAQQITELLPFCDGIMVARGDLGVEARLEMVPLMQKDLIRAANSQGKMVIVATQMLESMIRQPRPTRAEATDVANAILDGADAVMLSGETSVGKYPLETVTTMARIIVQTEASHYYPRDLVDLALPKYEASQAVCEAAAWASRDLGNIPILVFTQSGETAFYLAKIRPQAPLIALTPSPIVLGQLAAAWNMVAFLIPFEPDLNHLLTLAEALLVRNGCLKPDAMVVVVSGTVPVHGATNFMRIKRIGEN
ncbi:pyruvate kinase [candidate division KSB1 bacterium]|nr:pyruvate kinase [candidate division KSB1 bacterium]